MTRLEEAKDRFGMSDWEIADAYNSATGGFRSAPLPEKLGEAAYTYAAMQRRNEREEEELRKLARSLHRGGAA